MKKILRQLYKKTEEKLSGHGLDKYYIIRASSKLIKSQLKTNFVQIDGHKMFLDPLDSLRLSINRTYEEFETDIVKKIICKNDDVVDVGANIGYYTLIFSKLVGNEGRVFAFEPEPNNFNLLQKNIKINEYGNTVIVNKAVSNKTEKIKLYIDDENQGGHSLSTTKAKSKSVEIEAVTLDNFFKNNFNKIKFLKMDIEGSESRAVEGMKDILNNNNELQMMIEFNPYLLNKSGTDPEKFLDSLMKFDFKIFEMDRKNRKVLNAEISKLLTNYTAENQKHTNLLLLKHKMDNIIND